MTETGLFVPLSASELQEVAGLLVRRKLSIDGQGLKKLLLNEARRPDALGTRLAREAMDFASNNPEAVRTLETLARAVLTGRSPYMRG